MHINQNQGQINNPNQGAENAAAGFEDSMQSEILEDLGIASDELEDTEDAQDSKKEKVGALSKKGSSRKRPPKTTSMGLLKEDLKAKDLLKEFTDKFSAKKKVKFKEQLQQKFRQEYQDHLQDIARQEKQDRYVDAVRLSTASLNKKQKLTVQKQQCTQDLKTQSDATGQAKNLSKFQQQQETGKRKLEAQRLQQNAQQTAAKTEKSVEDSMQQFMTSFSEGIIMDDPKKKKESEDIKQQLQSKGVSTKVIQNMESQVQKLLHSDLKKMMKQNFIKTAFSYDPKNLTRDMLNDFEGFKQLEKLSDELGLFGPGRDNAEALKQEAREEVQDFIKTELDRSIAEARLKTDNPQEIVKAFDKLNNLASFSRFNPGEYMQHFHRKLDDMGLNYFANPNAAGQMDNDNSDNRKRKKRQSIELEDGLPLEDTLKRLYIKRYVVHGVKEGIKLNWDIMRTENKLKKAGKATLIEGIKKQIQGTAKLKLMFMLRDIFEERATLIELKGPGYDINRKNLKSTLKGLKALGVDIPKSQLEELRDQSNKAIFSIIKEDYIKVEIHLEANPSNAHLLTKKAQYVKILERLKSESDIQESIKPKLMQDLNFLSDVNIIEAA